MSARQFDKLRATSLYCRSCQKANDVSERLLLVLPDREIYEYLCSTCGGEVGRREVSAAEQVMRRTSQPSGPQVRIL